MSESRSVLWPLWPERRWWIALVLILVAAGALRYTGYNFSLPYIDHPDEPNFNIAAQMTLDNGSPKPMRMQGYPPGIIAVNYLLLRWFHDPSQPHTAVIGAVRLISITFNLGAGVILALLGYHIAGSLSGLLAAAFWAVTPVIVRFSRYATADNFVAFFALLAVWLAVVAALYDRDRWATAALVSIMLAVLFKYQAVFAVPLLLLAPLTARWRSLPNERRRLLANFRAGLLLLIAFFAWLVLLTPMLEANEIPNWVAPTTESGLPSPSIVVENGRVTLAALSLPVLLPGFAGLLLLFLPRFRHRASMVALAISAGAAALWLVGVSFYGVQSFRQFVALAGFLLLFSAVGVAVWAEAIRQTAAQRGHAAWFARISNPGAAVVILATAALILPSARASIAETYQHTLPDRRNALAEWMDRTLAPGPYIASEANHKTFNRSWGGYSGVNDFPLAEWAELTDRSVQEWRAMGVMYAIVGYNAFEEISDPSYRDETLLLKTYPPSLRYRGPDMVILRLWPIQRNAEGLLGDIQWIGYDIDQTDLAPGESFNFRLYWQAAQPTDGEYAVFNHLLAVDSGEIIAQDDGPPLADVRRPSTSWDDPGETLVSRLFSITIPGDASPGAYRLVTGFYQRETSLRLVTPDGQDYLPVTTIHVHR